MIKYKANACTDVTGFGIKGHALNLVNAQNNKKLKYVFNSIPTLKNARLINDEIKNFKLRDGFSPETSGGLMLTISKENGKKFVEEMHLNNEPAWIIGEVCESEFNTVEFKEKIEFMEIV
jgi:selenide,water dikinase